MFAGTCARNVWMFAHWAWRHMSDCSYAAMSNHKLTVANLCAKSDSIWTNFADNGKIHTCMYNVRTTYTTAVGVILPRQLARFRYVFCSLRSHGTRDKAVSIIDRCYRERWFVEVLSASCSRETVGGEMFVGKYVRWSVLLASLARHTLRLWALTRPSAQPTVPCHGKSGRLRLWGN